MKSLILFLVVFCSFPAFAGERKVVQNYRIISSAKNKKVPAGQSKVIFQCWAGSSNTLGSQSLQYSVDGENATVTTDKSGYFVVMTKPGTHAFQFYMDNGLYYEIYAGDIECKDRYKTVINLYFRMVRKDDDVPVLEKPVIYLYPEEDTPVSVKIEPRALLAFTYPSYENGWSGVAHPDGSITIGEKTYPYLFWEGEQAKVLVNMTSGFIVRKENVVAFLEEKLEGIGFTSTEQTDFITYWGPRLSSEPAVFVQFAWAEQADELIGTLEIAPTPDRVNRLYIFWKPVSLTNEQPAAQQLPVFDRSGFDVLEWGGVALPVNDVEQYE